VLVAGVRDSSVGTKGGYESCGLRVAQGLCCDCIGVQLRRERTYCAAAATTVAVHVRAKVGFAKAVVEGLSITRAGESDTKDSAFSCWPLRYYSRRLAVPAAKNGEGAKYEWHAARDQTPEWPQFGRRDSPD
jgi:hypothetical protein